MAGIARLSLSLGVGVATLGLATFARPAFGQAPLAVTGIWPRTGPTGGGTSVTVVGSGFTGTTAVTVDGVGTTNFSVASDSVVRVTVPPYAAGTPLSGSVTVTTPAGTSPAIPLATFTYSTRDMAVAVPSYIYPGPAWTQIDAGRPPVDLAVINPDSGPGSAPDPNYAAQVVASHAAGVDVIGYVHTSYGSRSINTVEHEISEYESWYHVDGIFVDEAATSCSLEASYYAPLYNYIHSQPGLDLTVLNPGTFTNQCYIDASDVVLTYEGTPGGLPSAGTPPSWTISYDPSRFWYVVYGASNVNSLPSILSTVGAEGVGQVYVTDQNLPNPYGVLASYWSQELAEVSGAPPATQAPLITSAASLSVRAGRSFSFEVTSTGNPTPTVSESGALPSNVSFAPASNGTASISGYVTSRHTYQITITAANGVAPAATQLFTLTAS